MPSPEAAGDDSGDSRGGFSSPWYEGGLRFACTQCGSCCAGGRGYVWVEPREAETMAVARGMALDEFGRRYLRRVGERYALLENAATGDCVFLHDSRCLVYSVRPLQCRSFPFWPANLSSPDTWRVAASECQGVSTGIRQGAGQAVPIVSAHEIARLLVAESGDGELDSEPGNLRGPYR